METKINLQMNQLIMKIKVIYNKQWKMKCQYCKISKKMII